MSHGVDTEEGYMYGVVIQVLREGNTDGLQLILSRNVGDKSLK